LAEFKKIRKLPTGLHEWTVVLRALHCDALAEQTNTRCCRDSGSQCRRRRTGRSGGFHHFSTDTDVFVVLLAVLPSDGCAAACSAHWQIGMQENATYATL